MDPQKSSPTPSTGGEKPTENNATSANETVITPTGSSSVAAAQPANIPATTPSWSEDAGTPLPVTSPKPKKKNLLIALIIALVILVLGGGAAAAYFSIILPNKPENVLKLALANSFSDKIKSEKFKGEVAVTEKASEQTFTGDFTGAANSDGAFELKTNLDIAVAKATFELRSADGKDFYLKVGGLEGLPELLAASGDESASLYAPIIAGVNDQWIEITQSMISHLTGESASLDLSDTEREKLQQAYLDHEFLTVKEAMKSEKISGKDSYHYKIAVDKQQLKDFIKAIKDAKLESMKLTQDDVDTFNSAIKDVDFSKYPVELWISKDQKFINQIKFSYDDTEASVAVTWTATEFNTPVTVTKPSDAKSLMEVISSLISSDTTMSEAELLQGLEDSGISL